LFNPNYDRRVIIFSSNQCQNIEFPEYVKVKTPENLSVENILKELAKEGIDSLLIEGGASVFSQFLPYADEVYGFYATKVFGKGKSIFEHLEIPVEESEIPFEIQNLKISKNMKELMVVMRRCSQGLFSTYVRILHGKRLIIENPWRCPKDSSHCVVIGESISVNGACLTVVKVDENLHFDVGVETLNKTNLRFEKYFNLERALRVGDSLSGHYVTGHVDGTTIFLSKQTAKNSVLMTFKKPREYWAVTQKGSNSPQRCKLNNSICIR